MNGVTMAVIIRPKRGVLMSVQPLGKQPACKRGRGRSSTRRIVPHATDIRVASPSAVAGALLRF